jgi:predicted GNAT family acetyltransferase
MADVVKNDAGNSRYVLLRDDQEIGQSVYRLTPDGIEFLHTEVDASLQEHGLGTELVRQALDDVRAMSTARVSASCRFVSRFLAENPEYQDLTTR